MTEPGEAAAATLENAAAQDAGDDDFLSREEVDYYLGLIGSASEEVMREAKAEVRELLF